MAPGCVLGLPEFSEDPPKIRRLSGGWGCQRRVGIGIPILPSGRYGQVLALEHHSCGTTTGPALCNPLLLRPSQSSENLRFPPKIPKDRKLNLTKSFRFPEKFSRIVVWSCAGSPRGGRFTLQLWVPLFWQI